jgi:YegS/Rv2252/BmrU family lipid kinase
VPRAIILLNPRSRSGAQAPVGRILDAFADAGWAAELWSGHGADWTEQAARRARDLGVDAIFGAGGDGMLSHILPAIMHSEVALGVVPLGTGNVWARELGLPMQPVRAVPAQLAAPPAPVDIGLANGVPFLVIASAGLDARIIELVEADTRTKALGQIAYPLAGFALAAGLRGAPCRVWLDDEPPLEMDLLACIVTNGRLYGGLIALAPEARVDDGVLYIALFIGSGALDATAHAARVLTGLHRTDPNVLMRPVTCARIETLAEPLAVQADGDLRGLTPLEVTIAPGAVRALGVK